MSIAVNYQFDNAATIEKVIGKDVIREIFLANDFTIKEGNDDLKPYVYKAAYALLMKYIGMTSEVLDVEASTEAPWRSMKVTTPGTQGDCNVIQSRAEEELRDMCIACIEFDKRFESMNSVKVSDTDRISVPAGEWREIFRHLNQFIAHITQLESLVKIKVVDVENSTPLQKVVDQTSDPSHPKAATEEDMAVYEAIAENYYQSLMTDSITSEPWMNNLKDLIGKYFDLGVAEGRESRHCDTADGDSGKTWDAICRMIDDFPKSHSDDSTHRREPVRTTESDKSDSNRTNITVTIKGPGGVISWPAWIIENALSGIFDVNVICHLESTKRNTLVPPWLTGNTAKTLITIVEEHQPWGG